MRDLREILQAGVAARAWPCAAGAVISPHRPSRFFLAGKHTYAGQRELRPGDLFDLASLSKVLVTTTLVAEFCQQSRLSLDTAVASFFPEFATGAQTSWREKVSLRHLLAHCAGLPAGFAFHRRKNLDRGEFRRILLGLPLLGPPGQNECYSDLGMMILGEILVAQTGQELGALAQQKIFTPLGIVDGIGYSPALLRHSSCVPTELRDDIGQPWQGVVHDENTRWLGGTAGHAGLFANILTLARLAREFFPCSSTLLSPAILRQFTQRAEIVPGSSRCLGWDSPAQNSSAGKYISPQGYGHTGFTGTGLWIDPEKELGAILLSNAVHPRREDKARAYPKFLRQFCDAVFGGAAAA